MSSEGTSTSTTATASPPITAANNTSNSNNNNNSSNGKDKDAVNGDSQSPIEIPENLSALTNTQLKAILTSRNLSDKGPKSVLIARINELKSSNSPPQKKQHSPATSSPKSTATNSSVSSPKKHNKEEKETEKEKEKEKDKKKEKKKQQKEKEKAKKLKAKKEEASSAKDDENNADKDDETNANDEEVEVNGDEQNNNNATAEQRSDDENQNEEQPDADYANEDEDDGNKDYDYSDNEEEMHEGASEVDQKEVDKVIKEVEESVAEKVNKTADKKAEEKAKLQQSLAEMEESFKKSPVLKVTGLTEAIIEKDLKEYLTAQGKVLSITFDGPKRDIAVVCMDNQQSHNAVKEKLNGTKLKNCTLNISEMPISDTLLFVGNLGHEVGREQLRKMFEKYGEVDRVIVMKNKRNGDSKGYGFIDFRTKLQANAAKSSLGSTTYNGRTLRVDWADSCTTLDLMHSKTIFVDRLPRNYVDTGILRKLFAPFGKIKDCNVVPNPTTGQPRGFAFIDYELVDDAEKAQKTMNEKDLQGFKIRVSFGNPSKPGYTLVRQPRQGPPPPHRGGYGGRGRGGHERGGFRGSPMGGRGGHPFNGPFQPPHPHSHHPPPHPHAHPMGSMPSPMPGQQFPPYRGGGPRVNAPRGINGPGAPPNMVGPHTPPLFPHTINNVPPQQSMQSNWKQDQLNQANIQIQMMQEKLKAQSEALQRSNAAQAAAAAQAQHEKSQKEALKNQMQMQEKQRKMQQEAMIKQQQQHQQQIQQQQQVYLQQINKMQHQHQHQHQHQQTPQTQVTPAPGGIGGAQAGATPNNNAYYQQYYEQWAAYLAQTNPAYAGYTPQDLSNYYANYAAQTEQVGQKRQFDHSTGTGGAFNPPHSQFPIHPPHTPHSHNAHSHHPHDGKRSRH